MNLFIAAAVLLTVLAVAWLIVPLIRVPKGNGVTSERLNLSIHKDQLQALEADLARGVISQADFETTRDELQLRLLDDTESTELNAITQSGGFWTSKKTAVLVGVTTPVLAALIYVQLGTPDAINPVAKVDEQQILQMIDKLATRVKADPSNLKGWAMLGRSYKVVGRFKEAQEAFEKAGDFIHTDPDVLVDYAELLGTLAGNQLEGKPLGLINEALKLNPEHPPGLMMAGIAAYQRGDFVVAVSMWEKLLGMIPPDSPDAQQMQANIDDARAKGNMPTASNKLPPVPAGAAAGMTPEKINEMVDRLAARLKDNPNDHAGWARLARAYKVQGRQKEALAAYEKSGPLLSTDADVITQYADLLATMAQSLKGKPTTLINQALKVAPKHPMALMMAGQAAFQAAQYSKAISHWENVLAVLPANSPDVGPIQSEIAQAKALLKGKDKTNP